MLNKSDNIYIKLEEKILSGEYDPGQRIPTENELCSMYGASRTSVRQALERLTALGLLSKKQGSGTYVNSPDIVASKEVFSFIFFHNESMQSILDFAHVLAINYCQAAATNRSAQNARLMKICINNINKYINDANRFYDTLSSFYLEMAKATQNQTVIKLFEMSKVALGRFEKNSEALISNMPKARNEIAILSDAISNKDAPASLKSIKRFSDIFMVKSKIGK